MYTSGYIGIDHIFFPTKRDTWAPSFVPGSRKAPLGVDRFSRRLLLICVGVLVFFRFAHPLLTRCHSCQFSSHPCTPCHSSWYICFCVVPTAYISHKCPDGRVSRECLAVCRCFRTRCPSSCGNTTAGRTASALSSLAEQW